MVIRKQALGLVVLFGLSACTHLQKAGTNEDLDHAVDLYWKAVHWQDAVAGAAVVYSDQRVEWLRTRDKRSRDLNVTSWDVQGEKVDPGERTATVLVKATWFLLPSSIEQTDLVEQRWIYKEGHWEIISEKGGPLPFP
jgi:hypothetical protein